MEKNNRNASGYPVSQTLSVVSSNLEREKLYDLPGVRKRGGAHRRSPVFPVRTPGFGGRGIL